MSDIAYTAAVITVSDRGFRGEREDTSGPALCAMLREQGWQVIHTAIVPDDQDMISRELTDCADRRQAALVLTAGGTGFSPRDITPEATLAVAERLCPGIPEIMRAESMKITPRACLSRGTAGIRGRTLIVNLPGSRKGCCENLAAVLGPLRHGVEILQSGGSAECAAQETAEPVKKTPSVDAWLREAQMHPDADKAGMYLIHNGTVRSTARSLVREGNLAAAPVTGMELSCDREKMQAAVAEAQTMEGVVYVRAWVNEGRLRVGDDIMLVLIGADTRPHAVEALQALLKRLKNECLTERELC